MKGLSLTEPMAWAIFHGKDIENRKWSTKVRGRVYIHASKGFNKEHYSWITANENYLTCQLPKPKDFVHGAIIGEVDIIDCVKYYDSPWAMTGQWHFVLANPVEYDNPIPYKGQLNFFNVEL